MVHLVVVYAIFIKKKFFFLSMKEIAFLIIVGINNNYLYVLYVG